MVNCDFTILLVTMSPAGVLHVFGLPCELFTLSLPVMCSVMMLSLPPLSNNAVSAMAWLFLVVCSIKQTLRVYNELSSDVLCVLS